MRFKGVIFDFNGTLIFDTHAHDASWHELIPTIRGHGFTEQELKEHVHGRVNREIFSYALSKQLTEEEAEPYGELKESLYRKALIEDAAACRLIDGVEDFFNLLKENNIPMAIATASPAKNVEFYRKQFALDRWFCDETIIYADGTLPGKPSPALFNRAIERLGIPAESCIIFEDSNLGLQAAKASGAGRIVGVYSGEEAKAVLGDYSLYLTIPDFKNLDLSLLS